MASNDNTSWAGYDSGDGEHVASASSPATGTRSRVLRQDTSTSMTGAGDGVVSPVASAFLGTEATLDPARPIESLQSIIVARQGRIVRLTEQLALIETSNPKAAVVAEERLRMELEATGHLANLMVRLEPLRGLLTPEDAAHIFAAVDRLDGDPLGALAVMRVYYAIAARVGAIAAPAARVAQAVLALLAARTRFMADQTSFAATTMHTNALAGFELIASVQGASELNEALSERGRAIERAGARVTDAHADRVEAAARQVEQSNADPSYVIDVLDGVLAEIVA